MKFKLTFLKIITSAVMFCLTNLIYAQEVLPFPPTPSASEAGLTMQTSTYNKRVDPERIAKDAPNILIILIDDAGPATPSTYGGEINTPNLSRILPDRRTNISGRMILFA